MPPLNEPSRAVFLSYASQDAEAVQRICDALSASGVEVWFDQSELTGGDAWDRKIRDQIKSCALFVPVISAGTNARREGYFRREWKLAVDRTHDMDEALPFLLPVVIDATTDAGAFVPEKFRDVQWTRLPLRQAQGELAADAVLAAFCTRVKKLLGGESDVGRGRRTPPSSATRAEMAESGDPALQKKRPPARSWLIPALICLAAAIATAIWQPWRSGAPVRPPATPSAPITASAAEIARVRARIVPDRWQKQDFDAVSATLDRLIHANPEEPDAWALRSIINSLQVMRNFDSGTKPLEAGKAAAERALRLSPTSPLGELALGMHLASMCSRGGDVTAALPHIERGLAGLPREALTRYAELTSFWLGYQFDETQRAAKTWLNDEPRASFPAWILGQLQVARRQPDDAEKWAGLAAADKDITGIRALVTMFEARYYLRADLPGARAALERLPAGARPPHRLVYSRWLLAMAERQWDQALQELARLPDPILFDRNYHGPKALLSGLAHQAAGRTEVALAQFRESERVLRAELAHDSDNEELHAVLAVTLACAGRADDARNELATIEPLMRVRAPSVFTGGMIALIAHAYGAMGDVEKMTPWLRRLLADSSALPFTPASLRIDPRFGRFAAEPPVRALLAEFAALDPAKSTGASEVQKSVAVLAFKNLGDDKDGDYFSEGISEELLNVLAKVPGLTVKARTSSFSFKDKSDTVQEIGRKLTVAHIVEGTVRKFGNDVRVVAHLRRTDTGDELWTDRFDGTLDKPWELQDRIAARIAQELRLKLGDTARAATTVNPEAYRLVLEGRHFWNLRTTDGFNRAEAAIVAALKLAPDFAQAHAGLADVCVMRAAYRIYEGLGGNTAEDIARARAEAQRAISLNPNMAEAYPALGYAWLLEGRLGDAESEIRKALALNTNYAVAHHWLAVVLEIRGRLDSAVAEIDRAAQLDPLSFITLNTQSRILFSARRFDAALATSDRTLALRPDFVPSLTQRANILLSLDRRDEAVVAARAALSSGSSGPRWVADAEAIYVLSQTGHLAEATELAEKLLPKWLPDSFTRGWVLAMLGRLDEAWDNLDRTPVTVANWLHWFPLWDSIRETPRFQQMLAKIGCAEEHKVARETLARMLKEQAAKK